MSVIPCIIVIVLFELAALFSCYNPEKKEYDYVLAFLWSGFFGFMFLMDYAICHNAL